MTTKKLLFNLASKQPKNCDSLKQSFKVIAKTENKNAINAYILVSDNEGYPLYLLGYRLDINYLCDIKPIHYTRVNSRDLKIYEEAVKED